MGSSKKVRVKDPDPTPSQQASQGETELQIEQDERRRNQRGTTRAKTILAGDVQAGDKGKKTILGG